MAKKVVHDDDTSIDGIPRRRVVIVVPRKLSREHLEQTLRAAAQACVDQWHPKDFFLSADMEGTEVERAARPIFAYLAGILEESAKERRQS